MTIDDVFASLERTSYGHLLHNDQLRRQELYELMAECPDPILSEMGRQLRDGLLTPRQLLDAPDYVEALQRGYETLGEVDLNEIAAEVDEFGLTSPAQSDSDPAAASPSEDPGSATRWH
ncbi:MAG TPA: hypothetical protein VF062_01520 [Candidatus Limnocylindrales bacterium]